MTESMGMVEAIKASNLAELEREAWRVGQEGTPEERARFSGASFTHSALTSGRLKIRGRPAEYPALPDYHSKIERIEMRRGSLLALVGDIWHIIAGRAR